jgi:hypothetical protein
MQVAVEQAGQEGMNGVEAKAEDLLHRSPCGSCYRTEIRGPRARGNWLVRKE